MGKRMTGKAGTSRSARDGVARTGAAKSATTGPFVTAAPVRTKAGSKRLAATLKDLGADPKVVEAADRD